MLVVRNYSPSGQFLVDKKFIQAGIAYNVGDVVDNKKIPEKALAYFWSKEYISLVEAPAKYTRESLEELKMKELQEIGNALNVKDNKKDDLIGKILDAQNQGN